MEKHSRQREQSELRHGDEDRAQRALRTTYTPFETAGGFIEVASRQSWGMSTGLSWMLHLIRHARVVACVHLMGQYNTWPSADGIVGLTEFLLKMRGLHERKEFAT